MIAWLKRSWAWLVVTGSLFLAVLLSRRQARHQEALRDAALRGLEQAQRDAAREEEARVRRDEFQARLAELEVRRQRDLAKDPTDADVEDLRQRIDALMRGP